MVHTLTTQTFDAFINKKGTCLVDFYAEWCGPCKAIAPLIEELSTQMTTVSFGKIDVDQNGEVAGQQNVSSIPCVFIYKDGMQIQQLVGAQSKDAYKKALEAAM
ncbi:MAG: thioredoxin [bacterium]